MADAVQVFMFDDGAKEIKNCSWDELRQVVNYLATENEQLKDHLERAVRMKTIVVQDPPGRWIWLSAVLFLLLFWVSFACL